jgi:hypothetical protein
MTSPVQDKSFGMAKVNGSYAIPTCETRPEEAGPECYLYSRTGIFTDCIIAVVVEPMMRLLIRL